MGFQKIKLSIFLGCFFLSHIISADFSTYKEKLDNLGEEYNKIQDQKEQEFNACEQLVKQRCVLTTEEEIVKKNTKNQHENNIRELSAKQKLLIQERNDIIKNVLNDFEALENKLKDSQDENSGLKKESKEKHSEIEDLKKHLEYSKSQWTKLSKEYGELALEKAKHLTTKGALEVLYNNSSEFVVMHKIKIAVGTITTLAGFIGGYLWYKNKKQQVIIEND